MFCSTSLESYFLKRELLGTVKSVLVLLMTGRSCSPAGFVEPGVIESRDLDVRGEIIVETALFNLLGVEGG